MKNRQLYRPNLYYDDFLFVSNTHSLQDQQNVEQ